MTQEQIPDPQEIVQFWRNAGPKLWFAKDPAFDDEIRHRYGHLLAPVAAGRLDDWQVSADGMLALILILDQFSRNLHRDSAEAYANDAKAVKLAEAAIERGYDDAFEVPLKRFVYMPFMHAEDLALQERLIDLCDRANDADGVKWGEIHADIIRRFGRFPHRNDVLGRATTPDEQAFLDTGGFAG